MVIAITGGIGSGKSTVGALIRNCGFSVYDCDLITNSLFSDNDIKSDLMVAFGNDVINISGEVDKDFLRKIICEDTTKFDALDEMLASVIEERLGDTVLQSRINNTETFIEVPLLFESNLAWMFDNVVFVYSDVFDQRQRMLGRGLTPLEADVMLSRQESPRNKAIRSDYVLLNVGSHEELEDLVRQFLLLLE